MTRALLLLFSVFICLSFISVSDCSTVTQFQKGSTITQALFDEKGKPSGTVKVTCISVSASGTSSIASMKSESFDKKGKPDNTSEFKITCTPEKIIMDISGLPNPHESLLFKGTTISVTGGNIEIPSVLTEGQLLSDVKIKVKFLKNGTSFGSADMQMKNCKVLLKENVTTAAGSFSCYKIGYDVETGNILIKNFKTKRDYSTSAKALMWYNAENGIIKSQANKTSGELMGTIQVTQIKK